ncbi:MAG TPA: ABC transporter substrate-binding protein, partial [Bdellovibrionota bacterium]|nr:ABC transporter substrate-binding protein [Bdellovibrionota bacterium]
MKRIAAIVIALLSTSTLAADAKPLRVATEGAFRPFNYLEGSKLTGFEVELAEAMGKKLGRKVEWVVQPFETLLIGLSEHRFDLVAASHAVTAERAKAVDFADPHYCTGAVIVASPGGPATGHDLAGKTVGVPVGTTYYERMKSLPGIKEVKTYPKDTDAFMNLLSGRIDAWVTDRFLALETLKVSGHKDLKVGEVLFPERNA